MLLRTSMVNKKTSQETVDLHTNYYSNEAKKFQKIVHDSNPKIENFDTIQIIGDSLHLPRIEETKHEDFGFPLVCSYHLQALIKKESLSYHVETWAQRYFTTNSIIKNWEKLFPKNLNNVHIIIHVGLNDYVERMFLEEERLAMDLYPDELKLKIVKFSQTYRQEIIHRQLDHAYVPFKQYKKNIQEIIVRANMCNVKSLSFVNIIALPSNSWRHTPRSMWNTTRFNMFLYDMEQQHDIDIIDLDRLIWEKGLHEYLFTDKMHLSKDGHTLLAQTIVEHIKGKK